MSMVAINTHLVAEAPRPAIRSGVMITGVQIRAARALLGMTVHQLAERSGVSYSAIQRAETVAGIPPMRTPNLAAIQRALEDAGVVFIDAGDIMRRGGVGVRLR